MRDGPMLAPRRSRLGPRQPGFTLVEMVVVMAVVALVAVLALPRQEERTGTAQRHARDRLRVLLEHARDSAHAQRRAVCVNLTATQAWANYADAGGCGGTALQAPDGSASLVDAPWGVAFGGATQVRFDARGRPVTVVDQTIGVGTLALVVTRETGRVQ
jgi:prepilin-type N-terminal cleavage/methylation domain-containing protein